MNKEIFINVDSYEKRVALTENKRLEEFFIEPSRAANGVGNIYKGKVESVIQGIEAAFVNLGLEKNGFLYVTDVVSDPSGYEKLLGEAGAEEEVKEPEARKPLPAINELLKKGDEILVQVVKEPISTKGARLTTHVSIPGRFLVLMPFESHIGLSKRIENRQERDRIRKIIADLKLPKELGFIVRTAAEGVSPKDFQRESRYLINLWNNIKARARRAKPPSRSLTRSRCWMSPETKVSPVGASMSGKIALPSARAWVNSAKHHLLSNQFLVRIRITASEPAISR